MCDQLLHHKMTSLQDLASLSSAVPPGSLTLAADLLYAHWAQINFSSMASVDWWPVRMSHSALTLPSLGLKHGKCKTAMPWRGLMDKGCSVARILTFLSLLHL